MTLSATSMAFGNQLSGMPPQVPEVRTVRGYKQLQSNFAKANQRLLHAFTCSPQTKVVSSWISLIQNVTSPAKDRLKIAIVGTTGIGKSTTVNTMLGVKKLIPTSGWRASTAVVTTVEYNDAPNSMFCVAEVQFLSCKEWKKQLRLLIADLEKIPEEEGKENETADIAAAKLRAVYPDIDLEALNWSSVKELMERESVGEVLNANLLFESNCAEQLHDMLQPYVDSKDKGSDNVELWPLIEIVRIKIRAPVLETGIVLVDLPGLADANAARGTVAQRFWRECDILWIMAPIIRAVDDKIARNLFNQQFKLQLMRDGLYQRMAFIACKTDDLKVEEIRPLLMRDNAWQEKFHALDQKVTQADADLTSWRARQEEIKREVPCIKDKMKKLNREKKKRKKTKKGAERVKDIEGPGGSKAIGNKRGASALKSDSMKRLKVKHETGTKPSQAFIVVDEEEDTIEDADLTPVYSLHQIQDCTDETENELKAEEEKLQTLVDESRKIAELIKGFPLLKRVLEAEEWTLCVEGRNEQTKKEIQRDFADGVEDTLIDLTQGKEKCEDDTALSDEQPAAVRLPVFTISSDGYRKLKGLHKGGHTSTMFTDINATGLPELMAHAHALGATHTMSISETYTNMEKTLLTSIGIWTTAGKLRMADDGTQRGNQVLHLAKVQEFFAAIESITGDTFKNISRLVKNSLTLSINKAMQSANSQALSISGAWGNPRTNAKPGLPCGTYKATCRRFGVYQNKKVTVNMPADLCAPFSISVARNWTIIFNEKIPTILAKAIDDHTKLVATFGEVFIRLLIATGGAAWESFFSSQLQHFAKTFEHQMCRARDIIHDMQRKANRSPEEAVQAALTDTFKKCAGEAGRGMYERMRDHMADGVRELNNGNEGNMFLGLRREIKTSMKLLSEKVQADTKTNLRLSHESFRSDCERMVHHGASGFDELPAEIQQEIHNILKDAEETLGALPSSIDVADMEVIKTKDTSTAKEGPESDDDLDLKGVDTYVTDEDSDSSDDDYDKYYK